MQCRSTYSTLAIVRSCCQVPFVTHDDNAGKELKTEILRFVPHVAHPTTIAVRIALRHPTQKVPLGSLPHRYLQFRLIPVIVSLDADGYGVAAEGKMVGVVDGKMVVRNLGANSVNRLGDVVLALCAFNRGRVDVQTKANLLEWC